MDCTVTPLKTLMGFSVHLNVQLKFYNLPSYNIHDVVSFVSWLWSTKVYNAGELAFIFAKKANHTPLA